MRVLSVAPVLLWGKKRRMGMAKREGVRAQATRCKSQLQARCPLALPHLQQLLLQMDTGAAMAEPKRRQQLILALPLLLQSVEAA